MVSCPAANKNVASRTTSMESGRGLQHCPYRGAQPAGPLGDGRTFRAGGELRDTRQVASCHHDGLCAAFLVGRMRGDHRLLREAAGSVTSHWPSAGSRKSPGILLSGAHLAPTDWRNPHDEIVEDSRVSSQHYARPIDIAGKI